MVIVIGRDVRNAERFKKRKQRLVHFLNSIYSILRLNMHRKSRVSHFFFFFKYFQNGKQTFYIYTDTNLIS